MSVALGALGSLDRTFAIKITLRHFFEPLYRDKTFIGYILGVVFRTFRVLIGLFVYAILLFIIFAMYILWALVLPYVVYRLLGGAF